MVLCLSYAAWALWFLGYPDQALRRSHEALAHAQQVAQAYTLARARHYAAFLHKLRRETLCVRERSEDTLALSRAQGFVRWQGGGLILRGWALAAQGTVEEGLAQIRQGLVAFQQTGELRLSKFQAALAEAYGFGGHTDTALGVLADALTLVHSTAERYYEAELYRLQGALRVQQDPRAKGEDAEGSLRRALAIACNQGAKSLELRTAMSLARLWQQQGKQAAARALLVPVYSWFTEGLDTADLQEAKALLEELGG
jgi:predicted ATPase